MRWEHGTRTWEWDTRMGHGNGPWDVYGRAVIRHGWHSGPHVWIRLCPGDTMSARPLVPQPAHGPGWWITWDMLHEQWYHSQHSGPGWWITWDMLHEQWYHSQHMGLVGGSHGTCYMNNGTIASTWAWLVDHMGHANGTCYTNNGTCYMNDGTAYMNNGTCYTHNNGTCYMNNTVFVVQLSCYCVHVHQIWTSHYSQDMTFPVLDPVWQAIQM
jgi:hypothetical protein